MKISLSESRGDDYTVWSADGKLESAVLLVPLEATQQSIEIGDYVLYHMKDNNPDKKRLSVKLNELGAELDSLKEMGKWQEGHNG